jgi:hypothetical protein
VRGGGGGGWGGGGKSRLACADPWPPSRRTDRPLARCAPPTHLPRSYEGPFTGRKELAGCGGGQPAISKLVPVEDAALAGRWVAEGGTVLEAGGAAAAATGDGGFGATAGAGAASAGAVVTRLPLGAWSVVEFGEAGAVAFAAGALADGGRRRVVAGMSYAGGRLQRSVLGVDVRQ